MLLARAAALSAAFGEEESMTLEDNIHARAPAVRQATAADRADLHGAQSPGSTETSGIVVRGTAAC